MTIRGGGNPNSAMAAMPLGEWTRRLGALPAEAYDCFMVETPCGFNRIQAWFARLLAANGRLPSDHRAADHPITGSLPPCSRWLRTSLRRRAEKAPSLTIAARDGDGNMRSGRKNLAARVEQKNEATDTKSGAMHAPLTRKAPYKPYAGKPHVRIWAGGVP